MKVIIAGGRDFNDEDRMRHELQRVSWGWGNLEIVSGMARGADTLGSEWARNHDLPLKEFPADWDKHGKAAGHIRNAEMADYAEILIAFWDGTSKGTKGMIKLALDRGLEVHVYPYPLVDAGGTDALEI